MGFGEKLYFSSQTVKEIGGQEVHIHHASRSENLIGQLLKRQEDAEVSTFQFCSLCGNLSWANVIHYVRNTHREKEQNSVIDLYHK